VVTQGGFSDLDQLADIPFGSNGLYCNVAHAFAKKEVKSGESCDDILNRQDDFAAALETASPASTANASNMKARVLMARAAGDFLAPASQFTALRDARNGATTVGLNLRNGSAAFVHGKVDAADLQKYYKAEESISKPR
jgi:hypothetical protein